MSQDASSRGLFAAADEIRRSGVERDPWLAALRLVGIGWATVELERAAEDLSDAFGRAGLPNPDWAPAERDALLGATAWTGATGWLGAPGWGSGRRDGAADGDAPAIVLLEPDTEGRLAATLARFDEGVVAIYLEAPPEPAAGTPQGPYPFDPARLGSSSPGPLGPARIVLARPTWGPHILVVSPGR
jgi:hypothetical protein